MNASAEVEAARLHFWLTRTRDVILGDMLALAEVVGAGPERWRKQFLSEFRQVGLPMATVENADQLFAIFSLRIQQIALSEDRPQRIAGHFLDTMEVTEHKAPTPAEIAASWEVESASTDEGQRFAYGGISKDDVLRQIQGELASTFERES